MSDIELSLQGGNNSGSTEGLYVEIEAGNKSYGNF